MYVLAKKTVDVQALRESIETLNEFENTLKKAKEERDALEHIIERFSEIEKAKVDYEVTNALIKIAEQKDLECTINRTKTDIKTYTFLCEEKISKEKAITIRLKEITNTLLELQLRYKDSDFARASETIEQNLSSIL